MEEKIIALKKKLSEFDTRELLGMISIQFITFASDAKELAEQSDIFNKTELLSPQKQYQYLAGLLMSTENNSNGIKADSLEEYKELERDIQDITFEYLSNFMAHDSTEYTPEDIKKNLVSMEAFTSYFDTGILRFDEQTEQLIRMLYQPFERELEELTGLRIDDYIAFYQLVQDTFTEAIDRPKEVMERITDFLSSLNPDTATTEEYQQLLKFGASGIGKDLQGTMDNLNTINVSTIIKHFGEIKGKCLIEAFSLLRSERGVLYYNGENPFSSHPLCWIDKENLFIVHPQFLLSAIFNHISDAIESPKRDFADRYKKSKAQIVEHAFLNELMTALGPAAEYHVSVCEEKGTKEHDIVIVFDHYIIIAEVKASKVREPFFNPQKAYVRVRDHFYSDSGIGGAYNQAINLKKLIEANDSIVLYENKTSPFTISEGPTKKIIPIVLTLNQFGGLAVNTSMILDKSDDQPFPWVCNYHDLQNAHKINKYLNKSPAEFIEYISWRIDRHADILSSDELDVLEGYYLDKKVKQTCSPIFFSPTGPSLIDKIYFQEHGLPYYHPVIDNKAIRKQKIGVNAPCPCGSGKKYKKCCRGKGIYD